MNGISFVMRDVSTPESSSARTQSTSSDVEGFFYTESIELK